MLQSGEAGELSSREDVAAVGHDATLTGATLPPRSLPERGSGEVLVLVLELCLAASSVAQNQHQVGR